MNFRGYIKYVSRKPVGKKPEIFTTGGYSGVNKDGVEIMFDWEEFSAGATVLEDGRIEIEAHLRGFDTEFFKDSNETIKSITAEELAKLNLTEVFYECYEDQNEENFIYLDVVEFVLYHWDSDKEYAFQNLKEYNEKYSIKEDE